MNPFTFAVLADSHIRLQMGNGYDVYPSNQFANARNRYVVDKINQFNPEFVIHLGDVVYPIPALPTHENAVQLAQNLYQHLKGKFYVVPGNHDIGDKVNAWVPAPAVTEESHKIFEKYWGRSFLSFNYEDCHFVLINSPVLNSGFQLEKEQKVWLEKDLDTTQMTGKRIFLFMHYSPYLTHPLEADHYDNISEPARSWLLSLLEKHNVEVVFAAHSHNFFYNRYLNTNIFVVPSVTFVRPDFSEMFYIKPALEYGRNDIEKLGFLIVKVNKTGHGIEFIRTHGLTDQQEETFVSRPHSLSGNPTEVSTTPVGVFLRHAWATSIEMPYDNLDEFTRKFTRNDYLLPALWELGIQKLRLPLGDLVNKKIRKRMRELRTLGHKFTVFSSGVPSSHIREMMIRHYNLVDFWEVIAPGDQLPEIILCLKDIKSKIAVQVVLSKLDTIKDQHLEEEIHFSHFPTHGFQLDDRDLVSTCITKYDTARTIDGFVFRLPPDMSPWEGIQTAKQLATEFDIIAVVHAQLPRESEGVMYKQDRTISNRIAETLAAALVVDDVEVFLDTFIDHDRGYFPRYGLIDRRYNPRPSFYIFRHLQHALSQYKIKMTTIKALNGIRAFALETSQYRCILLLSEEKRDHTELSLDWTPISNLREGIGKWMDLHTGKMKKVRWKQSNAHSDLITIDIPSLGFYPALLILEASEA
ncbi:MAG: metallophosphoesterase family protein [Candidatus Hodarchaeota archaeon]